jgi:hypothetical protein
MNQVSVLSTLSAGSVLRPNTAALDGPRVSALVQRLHELAGLRATQLRSSIVGLKERNERLAEITAEFVRAIARSNEEHKA